MINMIIDDFKVPIIKKGVSSVSSLKNEFINKKIIFIVYCIVGSSITFSYPKMTYFQ